MLKHAPITQVSSLRYSTIDEPTDPLLASSPPRLSPPLPARVGGSGQFPSSLSQFSSQESRLGSWGSACSSADAPPRREKRRTGLEEFLRHGKRWARATRRTLVRWLEVGRSSPRRFEYFAHRPLCTARSSLSSARARLSCRQASPHSLLRRESGDWERPHWSNVASTRRKQLGKVAHGPLFESGSALVRLGRPSTCRRSPSASAR